MKRLLAALVGAGVALGGGVAAWAAPGDRPNREAAKACLADARSADPDATRAQLREAVRSCLEAQGITRGGSADPEKQARREALKSCLQEVKAANPGAERPALREAARSCFEEAGISPRAFPGRRLAVRRCLSEVRDANPEADRDTVRNLVKECLAAG